MVILGIVLVILALLLGAALLVGTSGPELAGQDVDIRLLDTVTISLAPLTLVIAGMVTMFLLWLGLVLIKTTLSRNARQRRLRKEQEAEGRRRQDFLEGEHQLEQRRQEDLRQQGALGEEEPYDAGATRPIGGDGGATRPVSRGGAADETTRIPRGGTTDPDATRPIRRDEDPPRA